MTPAFEMEQRIKEIINDLKALMQQVGLGNSADEERVISTIFLYKFLNDKFIYNIQKFSSDIDMTVAEVLENKNDELDAFYDTYAEDVAFSYEDTIDFLINQVSSEKFFIEFDAALTRISNSVKNDLFAIETADGSRKGLFEAISPAIEASSRNNFAKAVFGVISQGRFDFSGVFEKSFDFYSAIFEYLIKDYNVASGVYAEYFTPQSVSSIIARCLVGMSETIEASEIYDPSAGSGSLVLHLAHELGEDDGINRAIVYTQDISSKSTRFLRVNMLLNGMTESLGNIIQGDTLLKPSHYKVEHEPISGLKKFDYITSNPPFKMDFTATRDEIEQKWQDTNRFFAGVPKSPPKKKDSMAIYLLFIQHIISSLKKDGKAAIVVPTGFITAQTGIEKKVREKLIDDKMLKGVISMPSNIFANTGTNVSVLFIDKANTDGNIILMDASKIGTKIKDGKNQKTVLSTEEIEMIVNTFINQDEIEDFSIKVDYEQIANKNYSFSAGQYFKVKIEFVELSLEEFQTTISNYSENLNQSFEEGEELERMIKAGLERLNYE